MRIRTVKPEFFAHDGIADLEFDTKLPIRIAFIGLWCAADRDGKFRWKPRSLGVQILPYDNVDFEEILDALEHSGFIKKYQVDGEVYGIIPSFTKHQVINNREQSSKIPDIDANDLELLTRASRVDDASTARADALKSRESGVTHAGKGEGKGREGKGKEYKEEISLPFDSEKFKDAWDRWNAHRAEKKKKLTPSTAAMQLKDIASIGEVRAIAMIDYSIKNGWLGLFEDKNSIVQSVHSIQRKPLTADQFSI